MVKGGLRNILNECGVFDGVLDTVQEEVLNFACAMHDRMIEKQTTINGRYSAGEALDAWVANERGDNIELLLAIGKNVSELAKANVDQVVAGTAAVDIANISFIVDTNLRKRFGS